MIDQAQYKINTSKIVHETIDGEVIIINFENGNYYSLNAVGKEIWSCTERELIFLEIVNEIIHKYDGNLDGIKEDINQLLTDLEKEELIILNKETEVEKSKANSLKIEDNKGKEKLKYEKPGFQKYTDMKEMLLLDPIHEVDETGWPATKKVATKKNNTQ
jgi:hypothetical protein